MEVVRGYNHLLKNLTKPRDQEPVYVELIADPPPGVGRPPDMRSTVVYDPAHPETAQV